MITPAQVAKFRRQYPEVVGTEKFPVIVIAETKTYSDFTPPLQRETYLLVDSNTHAVVGGADTLATALYMARVANRGC